MKRNILIKLAVLLPVLSARAQYVTYNHDETMMYQVTVMETGVGELTPRAFYGVVHNKYYQTANETNKLRKACDIFDISLLDHIIVTDKSYYSFADETQNKF